MKTKIFSVFLISLVLYSTGYSSPKDFNSGSETETLLTEDSDDGTQEFRRTIKISIAGQPRVRGYHSFYDTGILVFSMGHHAKYQCYLQNIFVSIPSTRLFVTLGSLII